MSESLFWAYRSLCWVIICEIICPARSEILHTRCFSTNITPTLTKIDLWIVISTSHTSFRKPRWYVVPKREIEADTIYHVSCACDQCLKQFLNKPQSLGTSLSLWKKNFSHFYLQDLMISVLSCGYSYSQKVTEHLGLETMAECISILFGGCQYNIRCSISPNFHNIWTKSDWDISL